MEKRGAAPPARFPPRPRLHASSRLRPRRPSVAQRAQPPPPSPLKPPSSSSTCLHPPQNVVAPSGARVATLSSARRRCGDGVLMKTRGSSRYGRHHQSSRAPGASNRRPVLLLPAPLPSLPPPPGATSISSRSLPGQRSASRNLSPRATAATAPLLPQALPSTLCLFLRAHHASAAPSSLSGVT